jgi:hypothetical protein
VISAEVPPLARPFFPRTKNIPKTWPLSRLVSDWTGGRKSGFGRPPDQTSTKEIRHETPYHRKDFHNAAVTALALSAAPTAKADNKGCSNNSLLGTFAYKGTGFVVTPAVVAGPFAEVGTQTFDGKGATTTTFTASQNGNIFQTTFTGTYTVNPDCTGTINLVAPPPPPPAPQTQITITLFFVIDDNLNEFHAIETLPGAVITRIGRRLLPGRTF